ncbi:hypothetical protein ANCCAN_06378 [Ancylostoma caninum]|uniref:Uncharacterized protein n=1 Tax=Ancylostoma caninum TaxID=29170 RepID=A0A368GTG2_ANCCA|nr:hypothetical protein ANCCAN_06378 [Ancylostoma caninum]
MDRRVAYEDVELLDANQLDEAFEDLIKVDVEKMSSLELVNIFYRKDLEELLRYLDQSRNFRELIGRERRDVSDATNAHYALHFNRFCMFRKCLECFRHLYDENWTVGNPLH